MIKTTQGKIHDYLWILLDFSKKGEVRITMPKHIQSILETAPTAIYGLAEAPYYNNLF